MPTSADSAPRAVGAVTENFWNLPNAITLLRIGLTPLLLLLPWFEGPAWSAIMGFGFLAISLTDLLDGYLARLHGTESRIGKLLDPLADKFLVMTAFVMFVAVGRIPSWALPLVIAILGRAPVNSYSASCRGRRRRQCLLDNWRFPNGDTDWRTNYEITDPKLSGEPAVDWDGQTWASYWDDITIADVYPSASDGSGVDTGKTLTFEDTLLTHGSDYTTILNTTPTINTLDQAQKGAWDIGATIYDTPLYPDPMTFATVPTAASATSIAMTASTVIDYDTPLSYSFVCDVGTCGANAGTGQTSSGW